LAKGKIYFKGLTKTKTREKVRSIVNPVNFGDEFESEFISDLIIEKHYFCSRKKLRPSKFRKVPRKGPGYNFEGYFLQQRWHKVSWDKCITTPNLNSWATEALRLKIQPILFKYKEKHPVCEKCRELNSEHVDHVKPEFKEICEEALSLMSESEWDIAFYAFDWWNDAPFKLPECNSALIFTLETHKSTILQAVCKDCHLNNARERKLSINTYSKG
jgi:hypothetical protein